MVTLKEIAEKAGVSIGTVSKVLNNRIGNQNFGAECIDRIKRTARQLGYIPNYHARSLKSGTSHTLGLLFGIDPEGFWDNYWAELIGGMMSGAKKSNFHFLNINEGDTGSSIETALKFLREQRIDALVLPYSARFDKELKVFADEELPVVLALGNETGILPSVTVDEYGGIVSLVKHLSDLGHRKLLWVGPDTNKNRSATTRFNAFADTCTKLDIENKAFIVREHHKPDKGWTRDMAVAAAYSAIIDQPGLLEDITGIICYNDPYASGVYQVCSELGLSIPGDRSVAAFDDALAGYMSPSCTAASHMLWSIGERAAEIAVDIASEGKDYRNYREVIPSELIIRKSSGPVGSRVGTLRNTDLDTIPEDGSSVQGSEFRVQ